MWEARKGWRADPQRVERAAAAPLGTAEWVRTKLGFDADRVQARLLDSASRRVILNCTRQWGKSTVTAAKAVHHALTQPENLTLVVSPSARQSCEFVRRRRGLSAGWECE